jgi:hypothetical protein
MAQISGVEVQSIVNMYGVEATSIISIVGVETINLPGWPSAGPTCETVTSFYSAVSLWDAYDAGIETTIELPEDGGKFYKESDCGGDFATTGYYVIGKRNIFYFFWDASAQTLTELEAPQPPAAGPTNTAAPSFNTSQLVLHEYPSISRGTWTGTGDITYVYKWYSNGVLVQTEGPYPTVSPKGGILDPQPSFNMANITNNLFTTIRLEIIATDDVGSTSVYIESKLTEKTKTMFSNTVMRKLQVPTFMAWSTAVQLIVLGWPRKKRLSAGPPVHDRLRITPKLSVTLTAVEWTMTCALGTSPHNTSLM